MDKEILGKTAVDNQKEKLGKIIRIEQIIGKTIKTEVPHAIIRVRKFLKEDVLVPIETKKMKAVTEKYVQFDILKDEFEKEVKKIRILREQQELYDGKSPLNYGVKARSSVSPMAGKLPNIKTRKK